LTFNNRVFGLTLIGLEKQVFGGSDSDSAPYTPSVAISGVALGATVGGDSVAPQPNAANSSAPPPHCHRRCYVGEEDQDVGDFLSTYLKLDFLKFDDSGDPLPWLNQCEHYFLVRRTLDHKRVSYVLFYLLDDV
jgi:hypothetical protein